MNDKQRLMIEGMDRLLRRFNKYPNDKEFTVEEIIEVSNEIYDEIVKEENLNFRNIGGKEKYAADRCG